MRKSLKKFSQEKAKRKQRRKLSIRAKVIGSNEVPRICAVKSNKHISVQVIDDSVGNTLLSLSTFGKNAVEGASKSMNGAKILGMKTGQAMIEKGIQRGVFDRNGLPYYGILAAFLDGVRECGVKV